MKRHVISWPLIFVAILVLSGCGRSGTSVGGLFGTSGGVAQAPADTYAIAYRLPLDIFTGTNLNSAATGKPLGLVVKIYQLTDYRRFQHAPLQAFLSAKRAQSALSDDLIAARVINVTPDHHYPLVARIHEGANYLGVVALFMAPAPRRWRVAFDTRKSRVEGITMGFNACALSVTSGHLITALPGKPGALSTVRCPSEA